MAIPIRQQHKETSTQFSSSENRSLGDNSGKKYVIIKAFQLILCLSSFLLVTFEVSRSSTVLEDTIICTCKGILIFYSIIFIYLSLKLKNYAKKLIWFNVNSLGISLIVSGLLIKSCWNIQETLNRLENDYPEGCTNAEASSTMKLISTLLSTINGVIYVVETLVMIFEVRRV